VEKILKCLFNIIRYPNLISLLNAVRALLHSNADSERTFSLLSDLKIKKRNSLSSMRRKIPNENVGLNRLNWTQFNIS